MKRYKTLLILDDDKDLFARMSVKSGIDVKRAYGTKSLFLKALRKIHLISRIPFYGIWYADWKRDLREYSNIIIHASKLKAPIIEYVRSSSPGARIIFWYWNPVENSVNPNKVPDYCEKWSFDPADCKKYGLRHNKQFYFQDLKVERKDTSQDILFLGRNKGRYTLLMDYKKKFESIEGGIKCRFFIMPDNRFMRINPRYSPMIPYKDILEEISHSKAILDIVDKRQSGLTLRPMEAIFHEKKLITNHTGIRECDFYHPQNIFILGVDKLDDLTLFLNSPYKKISDRIVSTYDFNQWLKRFGL